MRNLKHMGLALAAVFAMSAIAASAVSANQFHSKAEPTTLKVGSPETQKFLYETGGKTVECTTVGGSGEMLKTTQEDVVFKPHTRNVWSTV